MHIEHDEISALFECRECKKTFSGEHAMFDATVHASLLKHNVIGKTTYFISILGKEKS